MGEPFQLNSIQLNSIQDLPYQAELTILILLKGPEGQFNKNSQLVWNKFWKK